MGMILMKFWDLFHALDKEETNDAYKEQQAPAGSPPEDAKSHCSKYADITDAEIDKLMNKELADELQKRGMYKGIIKKADLQEKLRQVLLDGAVILSQEEQVENKLQKTTNIRNELDGLSPQAYWCILTPD
eukprot:13616321-Ditylum_brightwellii.AAC.2